MLTKSIPNLTFQRNYLLSLFLAFSTVSTVCVSGGGAGVDSAWEQKKLEASLPWRARPGKYACLHRAAGTGENAAREGSPQSTAPKMMAGNHFVRENEKARSENAVLARFVSPIFLCNSAEAESADTLLL